ncbi:thioredoxin-like protein slr0233 isoform X1 [Salvia splendens]|uniref:thioredoxin-like protein slr0233 isoform X1 n=1 Tax=Salvia splendens TaxID=180675 RepID=UPI001C2803E5|nr:thioredoxin-like protein slr0233 isoform X1 [Salvia splendens]
MAISTTAAVPIVAETSPFFNSKLAHFSSLQFPSELRISQFSNRCLKSKPRHSTLTPVASKKQSFTSFEELLENSDKPILVDFYATWCGPCKFMVPILDQVGTSMNDRIQIVQIDTEKYPSIANKYKIEALPTFILFKDGEPFDRFEGAMGKDKLIERIEASLEVKQ